MKVLLLDDPVSSLTFLEDLFEEKGIECARVWDAVEAQKKMADEQFDGVVASSLCILGDAITFCVNAKKNSTNPMLTCIFSPYPIEDDDKKFLAEIGIDHIMCVPKDDGIMDAIREWAKSKGNGRTVPSDFDRMRVMSISRGTYESALRDLGSRAKKLEEILENSSDVIYELDPYGRIILISKAIEKLTGYSREELLGMSALDVTSADSLELVASHISMLLSGGIDPPAVEIGVQSKSGHVIPAEMIVRPIKHSNEVVGILGIGRNVEERKRLEESLRKVINEKDFYLDLMSHDLQNFNQAIVGYLEMILGTENIDPKLERYAKGAFRQVMATAQLIAHLKRVAQIRSFNGGSKVKRDLKDIVQRSITNLQSSVDKTNVAISFESPEGSFPIMASDDLNDMLNLLVECAARYSLSDISHLKISLYSEVSESQNYWCIDVSGKNLRLSKPVVRCVMSQDYSGCQTIERPDLQLLVVRAIVETHGGTIKAQAQENGRGDRFVIRLPQA